MKTIQEKPTLEKSAIDTFFQQQPIAVVGVSRNKQKFGSMVYHLLKKKGIDVVPVNPNIDEYSGNKCYNNIQSLPESVQSIFLSTQPEQTTQILEQAKNKGIKNIWLQPGSINTDHIGAFQNHNVNLIHGRCILMFAPPVTSIHRIHRFFSSLAGNLPK